ncbi:hypothetical protein Vafri_6293 [Volvox africanus]|uniref:U-box domain-containing protein n=1 Tax=Volvox africanus TaxID=51714 RepID=A0A8J4EWQ6_9CHLO|nr:hypothetical protein Vafri_6293 [Volvox africanus]
MSNTKALENATSLERFLNRHVLFVQGIDQNVPKSEVLQVLNQVLKQPQQGRIDILTTQDGKMRGTAFLNYHNEEDAMAALEKYRFSLEIRGRPLRMQFASDREFKEVIQGPLVARFKVLIRNVPEEMTPEALFERFSQYGEILQVHTSCDHYGQHYAIIQYVETTSVQAAIRNANRERVLNHVLLVEPYKPNVTYGMLPRNVNQTTTQSTLQLAGVPAPAVNGAGSSRGGLGSSTLPGTTYAALQQQQELEVAEQERYFNERNSDSGGGGGGSRVGSAAPAPSGPEMGNGGTSPGFSASVPAPPLAASLAVSNFFAATTGPVHAPPAPGNLIHLLTTALHHVQALEEHLCCPITQEPLVDPVVAADGNTYERLAITAWLEQHDTSPLTNEVLAHKGLTPNNLLRKIAEELQGISHPAANDGGTPSAAAAAVPSAASGDLGGVAAAAPPPPPPVPPVAMPAMPPPPPQPEAPASVPVPVPVPISGPSVVPSYHNTHRAIPQQPNSNSQSHVQAHPPLPHTRPQQVQPPPSVQQQFAEYNQLPTVMRPTLMPTPVTFVHVPQAQPQPYQVQGTTYYAYRPMGM